MAYIPDYHYDIFLSYSHLDNLRISGQAVGWIKQFYTDLNILLSRRIGMADTIKFWWDNKKLDGSIMFNESIEEGIKKSAIMICLTSPGYLKSEYCKRELSLFYNKAQQEPIGLKVGGRYRILNVLLNNIQHTEWPKELIGTSGFHFHDARDKEDFGDPIEVGKKQFRNQLQDLRDAIIKLIDDFPKEKDRKYTLRETKKEGEFTIYFGNVSKSLHTVRKRTTTELMKRGYNVLYDIPPPFEAEAHANAVKERLQKADLSVHLLDQYSGKKLEGEKNIGYPQKQAELSLQFSKSKLIWVPAEMNLEKVEEEEYKDFIQGFEKGKQCSKNIEFIRGTKSTLTREIVALAEHLKVQQNHPKNGNFAVLLDTHYSDEIYALALSKLLTENGIPNYINPEDDDPRKNLHVLEDRIRQVSKIIFFHGRVSRDWVLERINAALQMIVINNYPVKEFFVLLMPPLKDPNGILPKQGFLKINVIDNSSDPQLKPDVCMQLLKNLKV